MKFDVVLGNPPYQEDTDGHGSSARPIYDDFVDKAYEGSDRFVLMITKSRWFGKNEYGLKDFRDRQTNRNIVKLKHWPSEESPFEQQIKGGVSYFLIDKEDDARNTNYNGREVDLSNLEFIPEFPEYADVVSKLFEMYDGDYLDEIYVPRSRTGFKTNDDRFQDDSTDENVKCYVSQGKSSNRIKYVDPEEDDGGLGYYKVITQATPSKLRGWGDMIVSSPGETFCFTYLAFKTENEEQSKNLAKYLKLEVPRFMLMMRKNSQDISGKVVKHIPLLDLDKEWSNEEVYEELGLKEERERIQRALKETPNT